ncbi:glycine zipper domain-containing protein [Luteimonas saliphila]|uniref:glycine zipper domain-containing protein n=1 Tax=Luteimonas saliphila TaxID=2804919 RepID=UPI00192D3D74|nr:glycine zipper domain-containing protein [Luteimonas saliphila]
MTNDNRDPHRDAKRDADNDANRDPITGAPGAHPVGTGMGAAAGGVAGAAIGSVAGPVGTVVGAAAGAVAGGLGGKAAAEKVNPTVEDAYWRENYTKEPYHNQQFGYDDYAPAYRTGFEARSRYADRSFDEAEPELRSEYERGRGNSRLEWNDAREATRAAWHRVERALPGDADGDGR